MSYTKQTWATGDVITANKMNHMEDGIANAGGGILFVHETYDEETEIYWLDKTWKEIKDAYLSTGCVLIEQGDDKLIYYTLYSVRHEGSQYEVTFTRSYNAEGENDYPSFHYD